MKTKLLLLFAVFMTAFTVNAQITSVAIVGAGIHGDWPGQGTVPAVPITGQMTQQAGNPDVWEISGLTVPGGECKFRANQTWGPDSDIWGTSSPAGTISASGVASNPGNNFGILPGTYTITLNVVTKEYTFNSGTPIPVVKLVGTAVTGGTITMNPTSPTTYSLPLTTFLAGTAQIEIDGVLQVGGNTFPAGDILSGTAIPVTAGAYSSVTYDNGAGTYLFTAAPLTQDITLIGDGVGSWSVDTAIFSSAGSDNYFLNDLTTFAGECKFRVNATTAGWSGSFGGAAFPTGTGVVGNDNITGVLPGNYDVKVNFATKIFSFLNTPISIIGSAVGGWADSNDIYFTTTDGVNYTLNNQMMTAGDCKFRRYGAWAGSLGAAVFGATGTATPSNDNITGVIPGTYDITFNKLNGAFTFTDVTFATTSFASAGFKVSPNPTSNVWNFTSAKEAIVSVQVIDMLGKVVATSTATSVDASALNTGVYFAKVTTANATATVKVVRN